MLVVTFYRDEITTRFKVHHADKIRMTYKSEDYGLQTYDIFQKIYQYQIFICNGTLPNKYLAKRLSPLDAIVMDILILKRGKPSMRYVQFIQLIYIFQGSLQSRAKLLNHGVKRKVKRGILPCIKHEELK